MLYYLSYWKSRMHLCALVQGCFKVVGVHGARGSGNRQTGGLPHDFRAPLALVD